MAPLDELDMETAFWGRPPVVRRVHHEVPEGATPMELVSLARDALGWDDFRRACDLAERARVASPELPGPAALVIWARTRERRHVASQDVDALRAISERDPDSLLARYGLIRALVERGDVSAAEATLLEAPAEQRDMPSLHVAEAVVLAAKQDVSSALQVLRSLRARWPARVFNLLTYEMALATASRDAGAFADAYTDRCRLEGRRSHGWIAALWPRIRFLLPLLALLWCAGVILRLEWLWAGVAALLVGFAAMHWHVLRSRSLTLRVALVVLASIFIGVVSMLAP